MEINNHHRNDLIDQRQYTMDSGRPSVRLLVRAYSAMLQKRTTHLSNPDVRNPPEIHIFHDDDRQLSAPRKKTKNRYRQYRVSPNDKQWLTWDASNQDTHHHTWLSDTNLSILHSQKNNSQDQNLLRFDNAADDGCHSDLSPSPTWSGVSHSSQQHRTLVGGGENSLVLSSGNSNIGSVEDIPLSSPSLSSSRSPSLISRSSSLLSRSPSLLSRSPSLSSRSLLCSHHNSEHVVNRSLSQDSAVDLESFSSISMKGDISDNREISRSEYTEQWNNPCGGHRVAKIPVVCNHCFANRSRIIPPSVTISDYSVGEASGYRDILQNNTNAKLSALSRQPSFVTEPLCEFGLSVSKVCPRKVSDCSTCSSVSTVDMSPESHLSLDEYTISRKSSCCSNCSGFTLPETLEEAEQSSESLEGIQEELTTTNHRSEKVSSTSLHFIY